MKNKLQTLNKKGLGKAIKIGKVAARLFSRKGFLATTMDEIAVAAKVSKAGMYYYFPSKTDILFFIISNYMNLVLQDLEKDLMQIRESRERIKYVISRHIELYTNHLAEGKVLLHEANCLPKRKFKAIAEKQRRYYQIVAGVLLDLFPRRIPKNKLTAITFILLGMCNWVYAWYDPKGPIGPEELSEIICEIFLTDVNTFQG